MKKEKIKKEDSNEEILDENTKKMKKKFKALHSWANLLEGILLVPVALTIVIIIISSIMCITDKKSNFVDIFLAEVIEREEGTPLSADDVIELANLTSGADLTREDYEMKLIEDKNTQDTIIVTLAILQIVRAIASYILTIVIIDKISNIFLNTSKDGTPFTEKNVKYLNIVNILSIILWLIGTANFSIGLVSVIVISAITYIFKYGYKLQQQVDETI